MTGTTISTYRTIGISIGYNGITSPLTVTGSGFVKSSDPGGTAIYQAAAQANAVICLDGGDAVGGGHGSIAGGAGILMKGTGTLINAGEIAGGYAGGLGGDKGHGLTGGDGVELLAAVTASNSNEILGGGGGGGYTYGGVGGVGVLLGAGGATLINTHKILGGHGGVSYYDGGQGGSGVDITAAATFNNTDYVTGGYGGYILKGTEAGTGGTGVALSGGGSFTNSGHIYGGLGGGASRNASQGGTGGTGVSLYNATGSNIGTITGGTGGKFFAPASGFAGGSGGYGGFGVEVAGKSSFANAGVIEGGIGSYGKLKSGSGEVGIYVTKGATVSNTGGIFGGAGATTGTAGADAGRGGDGAFVIEASLTNTGLIEAAAGATGPTGGAGGFGAVIAFGSLLNTGTIAGGAGGAGSETGGHLGNGGIGGGGVYIFDGIFTNAGTVTAGYGGVGSFNGTIGDAIQFGGAAAGTLVVKSGAVFNGQVVATATIADVLELAGKSTTALTGIGTQFTNFNDISFASGAAWKIEGDAAGLATNQTIAGSVVSTTISGFAAGDTIVLNGFQEQQIGIFENIYLNLISGSADETLDVLNDATGVLLVTGGGGNSTLSMHGAVNGLTLHSDNVAYVFTGGTAKHVTVANSSSLLVLGTATDTLVKKGGFEAVGIKAGGNGGVTSNTTLAGGGILELTSGSDATGTVKMTGTGNKLIIEETASPTGVISGFKSGDKIEFSLISTSANGTATVKTAGVVTVSAGGDVYKLNIASAAVGSTAFVYADGTLTKTAAATMAFQRPSVDMQHSRPSLPDLAAMPARQTTPITAWPASAMATHGAIFELVPHGGIQIMPTLQSG